MQFYVLMLLLTVSTWAQADEPATKRPIQQGSKAKAESERECKPSQLRTWIDVSGQYRVEGTYYEFDLQTQYVWIQRSNGKPVRIAIEKLSREDQEYVFRTVTESNQLGDESNNARMPVFATAVLARQPGPAPEFRYVYKGHHGTQQLAGLRGTTVYYSLHKYTVAALAHFGDDGTQNYVLYRVDEHGLEQEFWAFGKSAVNCYGFAVWRFFDSDQDGDFEWIFQNYANRYKAHAP